MATASRTGVAKEDSSTQEKKTSKGERKEEVRVMKMGTLNVGSMTRRGHEIVEFMKRRAVRILCVQETKWEWKQIKRIGPRVQTILCRSGYKEKWCWYYPGQ